MKRLLLVTGSTLVKCALIFQLSASVCADTNVDKKWSPWIGTGVFYGSDETSRGEVVVFAPFWEQEKELVFFDVRGKLFEHSTNEVNAAIGYRKMMDNGWNLGGWLGIDTRKSQINNRFWQAAGGVEALHSDWDLRANVYYPLSDPKSSPEISEIKFVSNQIQMVGGTEVGLTGFDAEFGTKVPIDQVLGNGYQDHTLRLYAGGFYFDSSDAFEAVVGPKVRAEWKIDNIIKSMPGSQLALRTQYLHDNVRDGQWEVGLQLVIPLSSPKLGYKRNLTAQQRRMTEGLERDTDIITGPSEAESVVDAATGAPLDSITVASGGALQTALDAAGERSLVIAQGNFTSGGVLKSNQTLVSGGSTISVRGASSNSTTTYSAPGSAASITHTPNTAAITLATNSHVNGLSLQGAGAGGGNLGVSGSGDLGNVAVKGNVVTDFGGTGISVTNLSGNGTIQISNNNVQRAGADGIRFGTSGSAIVTAEIHSNNVEDAALDGMQVTTFNDSQLDLSIVGNTSLRAGADAMRFDLQNSSITNLYFNSNTLSGAASDGLEFDAENSSRLVATLSNNAISDTTFGEGIEIDQDQDSRIEMIISGNTISNSFADPLDIDLDDDSTGLYQVINNQFSSAQPASIIDIDTNDNGALDLQVYGNTSNVNFDFDEDGASVFRLEDTLSTNTLTGGAALVIDPLIEIVPAGTFYTLPE